MDPPLVTVFATPGDDREELQQLTVGYKHQRRCCRRELPRRQVQGRGPTTRTTWIETAGSCDGSVDRLEFPFCRSYRLPLHVNKPSAERPVVKQQQQQQQPQQQ